MPSKSNVHVLLGSENPAKLLATREVVGGVLKLDACVSAVEAPSLVRPTPEGDEEAIEGCQNRLNFLRRHPESMNADYLVALEGAIERTRLGTFLFGWAVVENALTNRQGKGCSAKVEIPTELAVRLNGSLSLFDEAQSFYAIEDSQKFSRSGTNGMITKGVFDRRDEFITAIRCALGFLLNEQNFLPESSAHAGMGGSLAP